MVLTFAPLFLLFLFHVHINGVAADTEIKDQWLNVLTCLSEINHKKDTVKYKTHPKKIII